jgi:hypothetical protein
MHSETLELNIDELDAVSGGAKTIFQAVSEGFVKGFTEAGGTITCGPAGNNGLSTCVLHA